MDRALMSLSDSTIDAVREIPIEDVAGEHVQLKKRGNRLVGCCPFHAERTPSFGVTPRKGLFYCFGCNAGGDVIKFQMMITGQDFIEAIKSLATAFSIPIEERQRGPGRKSQTYRLIDQGGKRHALIAELARLHVESFPGSAGEAYVRSRGIEPHIAKEAGLGYCGADTEEVLQLAGGEQALLDLGLLSEGGYRFRDRLIFPIEDRAGRVISFAGRALEPDMKPKYTNGSTSAIFDKGRVLYGLSKAIKSMVRTGRVIVVEGYMDVLAIRQSGIYNVVAQMGTALTHSQASMLSKVVSEVILFHDNDLAGAQSSLQSLQPLFTAGLGVRVARPGPGKDPHEMMLAGAPGAIRAALESSVSGQEFLLLVASQAGDSTPSSRAAAVSVVAETLSCLGKEAAVAAAPLAAERLKVPRSMMDDAITQDRSGREHRATLDIREAVFAWALMRYPEARPLARLELNELMRLHQITFKTMGVARSIFMADGALSPGEMMSTILDKQDREVLHDVVELTDHLHDVSPSVAISDFIDYLASRGQVQVQRQIDRISSSGGKIVGDIDGLAAIKRALAEKRMLTWREEIQGS